MLGYNTDSANFKLKDTDVIRIKEHNLGFNQIRYLILSYIVWSVWVTSTNTQPSSSKVEGPAVSVGLVSGDIKYGDPFVLISE